MGKGAPLRWMENRFIARYLHGRGLEIGALWRRFPLPRAVTALYVDRVDPGGLRREYPDIGGKLITPDVVAEGSRLPFAGNSLDFVIASHVLEHLPFPLAALNNWHQVLAPGGVLVMKVPDKRYSFDIRRNRTPLQHLVDEHRNPFTFDKRAHFADWVEHVVGKERGSVPWEHETSRLMEIDFSIHYHVWTDEDVRELLQYTRDAMKMSWRVALFLPARFYRKECVVVVRKEPRS
jgi:SAM-dependent methyltransferase